jgi:predicted phosphodiesterase
MRVAVVTDIHANLEAFKEVLADIDRSGIDSVVCLGDIVGYGPDPEGVVDLLLERRIPCVMGNHELGVLGRLNLAWFNILAQQSVLITRSLLTLEALGYLAGLPASLSLAGSLYVHGFPPDSITTYLYSVSDFRLRKVFTTLEERISFVGHTHLLEIIGFGGESITGESITHAPLRKGVTALEPDRKYIVNAGSVGQPRDGNRNAKYVIWDTDQDALEARFIPYDVAATAEKIRQAGLPELFARRLW